MALINRIGRLFTADMHAVIDRIEEPEIIMQQSLREMSMALAASKEKLAAMRHSLRRIDDALEQAEASAGRYEVDLEVCLAENNDDLARSVIRRRLDNEARRASLSTRRRELAESVDVLERGIGSQQLEIESLRQKAELMTAPPADPSPAHTSITADEIEVALLQEKSRRRST